MSLDDAEFIRVDQLFYIGQRKYEGREIISSNHYHDAYEIYYQLDGERNYFINDRIYHLIKGDLVFTNIKVKHKTTDYNAKNGIRIVINFKKEFLAYIQQVSQNFNMFQCFNNENNVLKLDFSEQIFIEELLSKLIGEDKRRSEDSDIYKNLLLSELLLLSNRCVLERPIDLFAFSSEIHKKISEIVVFINENYSRRLTLNEISNHFYISPFYFSRSFKEVTGFTFIEYLNNVRTVQAQKLLKKTKLNVKEIAEKVGYDSVTHFDRVFKAMAMISPLKYRKNELIKNNKENYISKGNFKMG